MTQIFHLSVTHDVFNDVYNKSYPDLVEVKELEDLKSAAQCDHVAGVYKDNFRSNENFSSCDCVVMDIDNDGTEDKAEWINSNNFAKIFPEVEYYIIYSRHHMEQKKELSPRPRFHVYFPLKQRIEDAEELKAFKEKLIEICPAFDPAAKDAARFFFGVKEANGLQRRGSRCIDEFIAEYEPEAIEAEIVERENFSELENISTMTGVIKEGGRNTTLYSIAFNALRKYEPEQAKAIFDEACERCEPPLSKREIKGIWASAKRSKAVRKSDERRALKKPQQKKILSNDVARIIKSFNIQARFNEITGKTEVIGLPLDSPFISEDFKNLTPFEQIEHAPHELKIFLTTLLWHDDFLFSAELLKDILSAYIKYHAFNPVLEMLEAAHWDGQDRIIELGRILNITDNAHYMAMLRKWLIQAVAILHNTGNNSLDFVLTLQGRQGLGKTEFFRIIGMRPDWVRTGAVVDMTNKDSRIEATSCWICELGELDTTLRKEQASLKAFITQTVDRYRRPYATDFEDKPRRTCFCATVNDERFLRDTTGNRRWAVIPIEKIDLNALHSLKYEWLVQLWRQVYELCLSGETFRLTPEERERNEQLNNKSLVYLPAEQEIIEGLNWEQEQDYWTDCTATEVKNEIPTLKNIDVRRVGSALTKLAKDDPRIIVSIKHRGIKLYRLPSPPQLY